jgi:hypothetical protein
MALHSSLQLTMQMKNVVSQQLISRVLFVSKERCVLPSNSFWTDREMTILLLEPAIFRWM